jgi:hypothetical protein
MPLQLSCKQPACFLQLASMVLLLQLNTMPSLYLPLAAVSCPTSLLQVSTDEFLRKIGRGGGNGGGSAQYGKKK